MRRTLLALAALAVIGGATAASAAPPEYVHIQRNDDGSVCVGISQQVAHCTPPVKDIIR